MAVTMVNAERHSMIITFKTITMFLANYLRNYTYKRVIIRLNTKNNGSHCYS